MGRVVFVRHGQASLASVDYDRLSPKGIEQSERLGAYWLRRGARFASVFRGTLRRHRETLDAIARGLSDLPPLEEDPALNEYDSDALLRALMVTLGRPPLTAPPRDAEQVRAHFRLLRQALQGWMGGTLAPEGMPTYASFRDGVASALVRVHRAAAQGDVLIVSSGGPISVATSLVLGAPSETAVAMNMRLANSSLVELVSTAQGFELETFNHRPHFLDAPELMTHA